MSHEEARKQRIHMKRLKLPFRRRREGKTDYRQRHNLIRHNKKNYGEVKSRLVVRITNQKVVCQVVQAYHAGDKVVCSAQSTELKNYGIDFGLKNYAAAYATGFLCARKVLSSLGLSETYKGKEELDGEEYLEEDNEEGPKAYRCYLDLGLARATRGAKVFAAMKGACDGGLYVPHSPSKFVGYDADSEELDAEDLKAAIFGQHVAEYMRKLKEEDEEKYKKHFAEYIKKGVSAENIEEKYQKAFELIRDAQFGTEQEKPGNAEAAEKRASRKQKKLTGAERKERASRKFQALAGQV